MFVLGMPAKAKELLQIFLCWQAVAFSNVFRGTPAQTLCNQGFSEAGNSHLSCNGLILIFQQFNVFFPANIFRAAYELCQHKRPATTVEHCWTINISWQTFFTFVWCKNPGSFKHQVLHRKAGRQAQCLPQVYPANPANIIL